MKKRANYNKQQNKKGRAEKAGQVMHLPFGMIFSMILIAVFVFVIFFVIRNFLVMRDCTEINLFISDMKENINNVWHAQAAGMNFSAAMPKMIEAVCFANLSASKKLMGSAEERNFADAVWKEISRYKGSENNFFLWPFRAVRICKDLSFRYTIAHIALPGDANPKCFKNDGGKITIGLEKKQGEALVRIEAGAAPTCQPKTCSQLGKECGSWSDGCGGTIDCGTCPSGQTCSNGICVAAPGPGCSDECSSGARECVDSTSYKECGNYDDDSCTEWSSAIACAAGETCSAGICTAAEIEEGLKTLTVDGRERQFYYKKPSGSGPFPVIIVLHGRAQDADVWLNSSKAQGQFVSYALSEGYAIIAPDSVEPICPGVKQWDYTRTTDSVDLPFFDKIFEWIDDNSQLNSNRIYVAGISSGGFMTSRLALYFPTKIKAVAIHSAGNADKVSFDSECNTNFDESIPTVSSDHPPTLLIHGENDNIVPYLMGQKYYQGLQNAGIEANMLSQTTCTICHRWFSEYDDDILDWFNKH